MATIDPRTVSTAALAYFGDSVIELLVRRRLVEAGYTSSKSLNMHARAFVSAPAQAVAMERLHEHLTDEEAAVFRRGRNLGHSAKPRGATVAEYRSATGMEALFGYLHLTGTEERARVLVELAYPTENTKE